MKEVKKDSCLQIENKLSMLTRWNFQWKQSGLILNHLYALYVSVVHVTRTLSITSKNAHPTANPAETVSR